MYTDFCVRTINSRLSKLWNRFAFYVRKMMFSGILKRSFVIMNKMFFCFHKKRKRRSNVLALWSMNRSSSLEKKKTIGSRHNDGLFCSSFYDMSFAIVRIKILFPDRQIRHGGGGRGGEMGVRSGRREMCNPEGGRNFRCISPRAERDGREFSLAWRTIELARLRERRFIVEMEKVKIDSRGYRGCQWKVGGERRHHQLTPRSLLIRRYYFGTSPRSWPRRRWRKKRGDEGKTPIPMRVRVTTGYESHSSAFLKLSESSARFSEMETEKKKKRKRNAPKDHNPFLEGSWSML